MPLLLRPATEADGFSMGRIATEAFSDSLSRSIFPPHLHSKSESGDPALDEAQWRAARTLRRMKEGKPTFVVVDVPENGASPGVVVGFAQWEPPTQASHSQPSKDVCEAEKDPQPACLDTEAYQEMFRIIDLETKKALGPGGHSKMWYLMLLAVDPSQHRRGIGKVLVQHGLDMATRDGTDVFLVATPKGRGLYHAVGFNQIGDEFTMSMTPHYSMLWQRPSEPAASV